MLRPALGYAGGERAAHRGRSQAISRQRRSALARVHLCAWALWLAASGCSSLREIPRGEYGVEPERRDVRVVTHGGLKYEFDYIRVDGDTLIGYRHQEVEGPVEEFGSVHLALDDVGVLEARRIDWLRTGIIGAVAAGGVVVAGVVRNRNDHGGETSGGGKDPVP